MSKILGIRHHRLSWWLVRLPLGLAAFGFAILFAFAIFPTLASPMEVFLFLMVVCGCLAIAWALVRPRRKDYEFDEWWARDDEEAARRKAERVSAGPARVEPTEDERTEENRAVALWAVRFAGWIAVFIFWPILLLTGVVLSLAADQGGRR